MRQQRKRRLTIVLIIAGLCAGLVFAYVIVPFFSEMLLLSGNPFDSNPFDDYTFNQKIWFEDEDCVTGGNRRGHMAEDILKRLHPGMPTEQVRRLLGTPEKILTHKDLAHLSSTDREWFRAEECRAHELCIYYLGEELNMNYGIDRAWLRLRFNAQGRYVGGRIFYPRIHLMTELP